MIDEQVVLGILRGAIAAIEQLASPPVSEALKAKPSPVSDADLDSDYGNPVIKAADPRDWTGPSMRGKRLSECSPDYLFLLAKRYDYFAQKAEQDGTITTSGKPKAPYDRREAARCRGWARRLQNGWEPAAPVTEAEIPWGARVAHHPTDDKETVF